MTFKFQPILIIIGFTICALLISCFETEKRDATKPNIIIIYADDLGYGDVSAYGSTTIKTPNIDRLANGGILFKNGYASSATCSPSRYAILTGTYPWRNERAKILPGTAPLLIDTSEMTIPKMLKEKGYKTGVVGKWHLGLGAGNVNWNQHISPGPYEVGFDYSFIMAATQDRVPTVYIQNGDVVGLDPSDPIEINYDQNFEGEPTAIDHPELVKMKWHHGHNNSIVNGIPRIGFMKGGESAKWIDEDMVDVFLTEAQSFIVDRKSDPFFLFYTLQQPHVPRTPHPRFVGQSGLGPRGDVIVEADWAIGQLLQTLEQHKLIENTLVILSSDNGPVLNDGYYDNAVEMLGDHTPNGGLRGGKYSLFEAGTRVPFITYWKGKIKPLVSTAIVSQIDILSSLSSLVKSNVVGKDSENHIDVLLGTNNDGRRGLILEATSKTAYRENEWIYIPPYPGPAVNKLVNIELGNSEEPQLYNLKDDIGQQNNLAKSNPDKLAMLKEHYEQIRGVQSQPIEQLELK